MDAIRGEELNQRQTFYNNLFIFKLIPFLINSQIDFAKLMSNK